MPEDKNTHRTSSDRSPGDGRRSHGKGSHDKRRPQRFLVLLVVLAVLMIANPIVDALGSDPVITRRVAAVVFLVMLFAAVHAVATTWRTILVTLLLAAPALVFNVWNEARGGPTSNMAAAAAACGAVFLAYVIVISLKHLFRSQRVTSDTIHAALCVYLLLGVFWANIYALISALNPEAFSFPVVQGDPSLIRQHYSVMALYYSFVTMTTLGYGEIVPLSPVARMCAVSQAVMGQLYLAVLVARLVGLHIVHSSNS